jgi:hypothetical protein
MLYIVGAALIWLSILLFFKRLANRSSRLMDISINVCFGIAAVITLLPLLFTTFACKPIAASWSIVQYVSPDRKCLDQAAILLALSIIHVVFDFALLLIPIRLIWKVQLPLRARVSLIIMFCFGSLACVFAIMRLLYINQSFNSFDFTGQ